MIKVEEAVFLSSLQTIKNSKGKAILGVHQILSERFEHGFTLYYTIFYVERNSTERVSIKSVNDLITHSYEKIFQIPKSTDEKLTINLR